VTNGSNFRRAFPRTSESLRSARKIVTDFVRTWLSGEAVLDFEIAVGEALANVVEHGGGRTFVVACERENDRVIVEITDRGLGFHPPPDRERKPESGALRGYGIFLMRHLLDEVEYLDGGTRLRLIKATDAARAQKLPRTNDVC
jgi:anti-sigma regulatory factor (Ser/Thr protein kinase)